MAEYSSNALQTVAVSSQVIFTENPVPDGRGFIFHRDESGVFRLASPSKIAGKIYGGCCCNRKMLESVYQVTFHANIGIPEGATTGAISLALSIDGTIDPSSTMIVPAAVASELNNVGASILVAVPAICGCESVSVVNTSTQAINVQNANLIITYAGIKA